MCNEVSTTERSFRCRKACGAMLPNQGFASVVEISRLASLSRRVWHPHTLKVALGWAVGSMSGAKSEYWTVRIDEERLTVMSNKVGMNSTLR